MSDHKFDVDETWKSVRENKFTRKMLETRVDRQKFKDTQRQEQAEREQHRELSEEELEELEAVSMRDPLTGIFNKRAMLRKLEYELRRAKRYKRPLSLMVLAVDNMEQYQRQYGTMIVEEMIKVTTRILTGSIRDVDISGRCEGETLAVIFPETYSSRAMVVAERVRERMKTEPVSQEMRHLRMTVSLGVVSFPTHARDEHDLMARALEFMARAASEGGDRVHNG